MVAQCTVGLTQGRTSTTRALSFGEADTEKGVAPEPSEYAGCVLGSMPVCGKVSSLACAANGGFSLGG